MDNFKNTGNYEEVWAVKLPGEDKGTVMLHVDGVGINSEIAVDKFERQPAGRFHVWFAGKLEVLTEPLYEEGNPTHDFRAHDFRERLNAKKALIRFDSESMSQEWAELNKKFIGIFYDRLDSIEGKIFSDHTNLTYLSNIAANFGSKDTPEKINFRLGLELAPSDHQPKNKDVNAYAIVEVEVGVNRGDFSWDHNARSVP